MEPVLFRRSDDVMSIISLLGVIGVIRRVDIDAAIILLVDVRVGHDSEYL